MSETRVRFAPSPTGELHIGGARTALFNYLFARKEGGKFVLRIDDTDLERSRREYIEKLIDTMRWLGLHWDEGPYFQSRRLDEYNREAEKLLSGRKAYRCYCSQEVLAAAREEARRENRTYLYPGTCRNLAPDQEEAHIRAGRKAVIRLLTPASGQTVISDLIRGEVIFENSDLDDFIIVKSNGLPTYNFASIIDDLDLGISDVIRAEEHLSNTPRQVLCASALGRTLPRFAHVPMILAPDRSKLSKRHGATAVEEFRAEGYLPEALINYIALLGWSPGEDEEILSLPDMTKRFNLQKVTKTAAVYDLTKLTWVNSRYIHEYDLDQLLDAARPFFEARGLLGSSPDQKELLYTRRVLAAVRLRAKTLDELADAASYFFLDLTTYDEKGVKKHFKKEGSAGLLRSAAEELQKAAPFDALTAENSYQALCEREGIPAGRLAGLTRLALTGRSGGPGLFEVMELLGQSKAVERLKKAAEYIDKH